MDPNNPNPIDNQPVNPGTQSAQPEGQFPPTGSAVQNMQNGILQGTQVPQSVSNPQVIQPSNSHSPHSYKLIIIIFIIVIVIAGVVYGVVMLKSGSEQNTATTLSVPPTPVVRTPTTVPVAVASPEEQEVDAVDTANIDISLQDVDQEMTNL